MTQVRRLGRYRRLKSRSADEKTGRFPEAQAAHLVEGEQYAGQGVALDAQDRMLHLPDADLSDEELLQIIDFNHKVNYSIYKTVQARPGFDWEERMKQLDNAQVDAVYLAMFGAKTDTSGMKSRPLSDEEQERYQALNDRYEQEGLNAQQELTVIASPGDYSGAGVALCLADSTYYLPEQVLSDEEFLQIIDFEHKASSCINRIYQEVQMGLRQGFPGEDANAPAPELTDEEAAKVNAQLKAEQEEVQKINRTVSKKSSLAGCGRPRKIGVGAFRFGLLRDIEAWFRQESVIIKLNVAENA